MLNEQVWSAEDDKVVDDRPPIELSLHSGHHCLFNFLDRLSVIFESECLVLIMDQTFPAPDWEADFLPEGHRVMMILMY